MNLKNGRRIFFLPGILLMRLRALIPRKDCTPNVALIFNSKSGKLRIKKKNYNTSFDKRFINKVSLEARFLKML